MSDAAPELKLFVSPNSCARVPTIALEEIGVPFETELVSVMANQQNSPEYLKINPKGKVPVLLIEGAPLTENVAILSWLNATFPKAHLLPKPNSTIEAYYQTADLSFFSATVHPLVTRVAMPLKFIDDAELSFEIVRPKATKDMRVVMAMVNARLENGPWWYGDQWSVVDGYLFWVWSRITGIGFEQDDFPNIRAHCDLMNARPAVQRVLAREAVNVELLKSQGLYNAPH